MPGRSHRVSACEVLTGVQAALLNTLASTKLSFISVPASTRGCHSSAVLLCVAQVLACVIDVGTDNAALRRDPLYCGLNMPRLTGKAYYDVVDEVSTPGTTSRASGTSKIRPELG